ncbi:MAG: phage protease, partial [Zoogloeaceae bacterium]|nr:phage protease [Zoogloeaceae bacterium]
MMNYQTASHAIAFPEDGKVPEWIQLLPSGQFSGRDGRGPYRTDASSIKSWFDRWGERVIDYEHPTERHGQPVPAAGWIRAIETRPGGIYGRVEWTARAKNMIAEREYRYISPVFDYDKTGRVARIVSAGLTNQPNLFLTAFNRQEPSGDDDMEDFLQRARQLFGAADLTKDAALAELDKLIALTAAPEMKTARQTLGVAESAGLADFIKAAHSYTPPKPATDDSEAATLKTELTRALQRILTLEQKSVGDEVEKLIAEGRAAHKI